MKIIYVIGPFRAGNAWEIEQNIRKAEEVALEILKMGATALCPHTMCRFYQGAAPDDVWLKADLRLLEMCDAAITVGEWGKSTGSMAEINACLHKIPIFHSLGEVKVWLRGDD